MPPVREDERPVTDAGTAAASAPREASQWTCSELTRMVRQLELSGCTAKLLAQLHGLLQKLTMFYHYYVVTCLVKCMFTRNSLILLRVTWHGSELHGYATELHGLRVTQ